MGISRPFAFGQFSLYEGRDSYSLRSAEITNYFEDLAQDMEGTCYGSYFLELADYYARENEDATGLLKLLYQSVRALLKPALKNELVQRIFELKTMVLNGEYTEAPPRPVSDSANYAWEYVIASPVEHLYTFTLTEPVLEEFARCVEMNKKRFIDREFHSLDILHTMM
jgi:DNA repair protein RecO (recombination protein O)